MMVRLIDVEEVDMLVVDMVNFQDSALVVSIYCGLSKEEICNLTIDSIDELNGIINLEKRQIKMDDIDNELHLIPLLKVAHEQELYIENNGVAITEGRNSRYPLDVNTKLVFKGIDEKYIDDKLNTIAEWFDCEEFLSYDNLRVSGVLAKEIEKIDPVNSIKIHFDKDGEPISLAKWMTLSNNEEYRIIKQDRLNEDYFISTVWTGMDTNVGLFYNLPNYKPLVFETAVFVKNDLVRINKWRDEEIAFLRHEEEVERCRKEIQI